MRYPASEKLEIIRTVENSHLPTKQPLDMLGVPRTTFYRWYYLYLEGGSDRLADKSPCPKSVWNRIPDDRRDDLIALHWSMRRSRRVNWRSNTLMRNDILYLSHQLIAF